MRLLNTAGLIAGTANTALAVVNSLNSWQYPGPSGGANILWTIGSERPLKWYTELTNYNITLWQNRAGTWPLNVGAIWQSTENNNAGNISYNWKVDPMAAELKNGENFFLWGGWQCEDQPGCDEPNEGFTSWSFNLTYLQPSEISTSATAPATESAAIMTSSTLSTTRSADSTPTPTNSAQGASTSNEAATNPAEGASTSSEAATNPAEGASTSSEAATNNENHGSDVNSATIGAAVGASVGGLLLLGLGICFGLRIAKRRARPSRQLSPGMPMLGDAHDQDYDHEHAGAAAMGYKDEHKTHQHQIHHYELPSESPAELPAGDGKPRELHA